MRDSARAGKRKGATAREPQDREAVDPKLIGDFADVVRPVRESVVGSGIGPSDPRAVQTDQAHARGDSLRRDQERLQTRRWLSVEVEHRGAIPSADTDAAEGPSIPQPEDRVCARSLDGDHRPLAL